MSREDNLRKMRNMMMTDQQYQLLLGKSIGPSSVSSQLQPPQGAQYPSRKLYADRVAATDPYQGVESRLTSLAGSAVPYPTSNRVDKYSDAQDIRAQLAAERRNALLPSPALVDYSAPSYVGTRVLAGAPISPEVVGAYSGRYPSPTPQRAAQALSNADLLAARARRSEIAASHPGGYGNEVRRIPPASSYDEPSLFSGQAVGILGPGVARRGRELDQYLLSVQPEKLVRYAASVLAPDPVLRRSGYPMPVSNLNSEEDDRYSNYRRAKARRIGSHEFGGSEPGAQRARERDIYREREREQYRERRGGGESGRERGRRSPGRRETSGSLSKAGEANRLDRLNNTSQSSEGNRGQRNGGRNKRSRPSETSGKLDTGAEPKEKLDNAGSDKDSELGSLCVDLSDSDEEKVEKKDDAATVIDDPLAGMIFGCSSATFHECMRLQLFGLPAKSKDDVMRVTPGTKVFLFNFDTKELSGIFEAVSHGGWQIQPDAFQDFGGFPAQVQVCCSEQCPNIPQSVFKPAIKENYISQTRFRFDLNSRQVKDLVRMFREGARKLQKRQDPLADRYLSARLQSEDFLARGGHQQRPYPRHPQARYGISRVPYARVISMSAKSSNRKSKRASKRALRGRKKRKVSNKPESPLADNCSLYSLSGEIQEADVTINASGCDDASNTNTAVIVREGIEAGQSRNFDQQKEIIETPAARGIAPSGPDHGLSPSNPEEFPQLHSDLGKQVSFLKESCNDGNVRLAGSRADERGQGLGLDVLQGALSSGNVIKSSDCTLSSTCEGICYEVHGDFSTTGPAMPLVTLGGHNVQKLAPPTHSDDQLSELDEKRSRDVLGDISVPAHDSSHGDLSRESISTECGTGKKLPDVHIDEMLMETVNDEAVRQLSLVGKNDELEVIAAEVVNKNDELEVTAAEVTIGPEAPSARVSEPISIEVVEERMATEVVGKDEESEVTTAEVAIDSEPPFVIEEATIPSPVVRKDEVLEVISGDVLIDYESPCVRDEVARDEVARDEESKVIAADVAIDYEVPCVREEVENTAGAAGEDQILDVIAAEFGIDSDTACVREKVMVASGALGEGEEDLEVIAAGVAVSSATPSVREEGMPVAGEIAGELEMIDAEVAVESGVSSEREQAMIADGVLNKDEEGEVTAADQAGGSEAPCVREEVMIAAPALNSQPCASADVEDIVTVHDDTDQGEELILAAEAVDSEQLSPDRKVIRRDDEDEEEVVLAGNAADGELVTSAEEDEEVGKGQEYEYDEGDDEEEDAVDVSVDGELSNVGEDGDEDEDIGEGVDDDASYDD